MKPAPIIEYDNAAPSLRGELVAHLGQNGQPIKPFSVCDNSLDCLAIFQKPVSTSIRFQELWR